MSESSLYPDSIYIMGSMVIGRSCGLGVKLVFFGQERFFYPLPKTSGYIDGLVVLSGFVFLYVICLRCLSVCVHA